MIDILPKKPYHTESAVVNLDSSQNNGTHWVCYQKSGNNVYYFDSYGDLQPPTQLLRYLRGSNVRYNYKNYQKYNSYNCGHLCLKFLSTKYDMKL